VSRVTAVLCDNGESNLERCLLSLRGQTLKPEVVVASGPKTNVEVAEKYADRVLEPVEGIGRARVQAILSTNSPYIISADSDCVYDKRYVEFAVEDLEAGMRAVKAGTILPLEWKEPLTLAETAFSLIPPYEFALAFRREDFLKAGIVEEAERYGANPRWDIGGVVVTRLNAWPDFRLVCWTRMPTKGAWSFVENYAVPLLAGATPVAVTAGVVGVSRLFSSPPKQVQLQVS